MTGTVTTVSVAMTGTVATVAEFLAIKGVWSLWLLIGQLRLPSGISDCPALSLYFSLLSSLSALLTLNLSIWNLCGASALVPSEECENPEELLCQPPTPGKSSAPGSAFLSSFM
ncbi:hypothetical protein LR48_Vigan03g092200 [Vigna angularis]|uniref:Uncharacterized protein n=1 Tax=Phaseolus angularis TaxID=3914 RepID=A0A0L9U432_PHAAN|nr:hypothetical protein LR48_Vigan03g092200 [Vigna angularis]